MAMFIDTLAVEVINNIKLQVCERIDTQKIAILFWFIWYTYGEFSNHQKNNKGVDNTVYLHETKCFSFVS